MFGGLHASTFRLAVMSTLRGVCWEFSWAKLLQAELRSGGLLWRQLPKAAQVELRCGRV